ncbi:hypothetical protein [Stenotrophomonas sp. PS02289]|uniref:hypothetical protein n=1 Tax=Stenotrophomonas sp. PS02289 TaxID=2991422 RepID=UPI00249A739B|nr:hypothetical protein [Stenotrophomonas sp. PS02289]
MLLVIDFLSRFWNDLIARTDGVMTFRLFLQPIMALITALIDGIHDARRGRGPYFQRLVHADGYIARRQVLREGVSATARILLLGVGMDVIYQIRTFGGFPYPLEAFVVAVLLAFIPYLLLRGPFRRLAGQWIKPRGDAE